MANKSIDSKYIKISIATGTTRDLIASWASAPAIDHTKGFEVIWQFFANGSWVTESDSTGQSPKTDWKDLTKTSTKTAPDNATKARVKVKPIADTYKEDNSDKNYYEGVYPGEFSKVFSDWGKTTKPPIFKIEQKSSKDNRDNFRIYKSTEYTGKIGGAFTLHNLRMSKFITYFDSLEFTWEGWNGATWTSVTPEFSYFDFPGNHSYNDPNYTGYVGSGINEINVTDAVKNAVRAETTAAADNIHFRTYISPEYQYRTYKLTVLPKSNNEYAFEAYSSFITKEYKAKEFVFSKKDIKITYDVDEDSFEASWKTSDLDKFSEEIGHVTGFDFEWSYMKPTIDIWHTTASQTEYDIENEGFVFPSPETGSIGVNDYEEQIIKTQVKTEKTVSSPIYGTPQTPAKTSQDTYAQHLIDVDMTNIRNQEIMSLMALNTTRTETTTTTVDTMYHVWTVQYQLPSEVRPDTQIRFRIKIKGDNTQSFIEAWSDWFYYSNNIKDHTVGMAMISKPTLSSRKLDLIWTEFNPLYTSGFTYQWYTMIQNSNLWRDGSGNTVEINNTADGFMTVGDIYSRQTEVVDTKFGPGGPYSNIDLNKTNEKFTDPELNTCLIQRTPGLVVWTTSWDVPSDAVSVMATITPNPSTSGAYLGKPTILRYDIAVPTLRVDDESLTIQVENAANREFIATWDNVETRDGVDYSEYIANYECRWEYKENNVWKDQSGTTAYSKLTMGTTTYLPDPYSIFTVPEHAKDIRFTVRPVATNADIFKGIWTEFKERSVIPDNLFFSVDDLSWSISSSGTRDILVKCSNIASVIPNAAWPTGEVAEDKKIAFEWSYFQDNIWQIEANADEKRVDYPYSTYTIPEEVSQVRVRVKPVINTLEYIGQWSDYLYIDTDPQPYIIGDVTAIMLSGSRTTAFATWIPHDIPEGLTLENYIENFDCQWRYEYADYWWPSEDSQVGGSDRPSDFKSVYQPSQINTTKVGFRVRANPKRDLYFKAAWSDEYFVTIPLDNIPEIPSTPTVTLGNDGYTMYVSASSDDVRTAYIDFQCIDVTDINDQAIVDSASIYLTDGLSNTATWQFTGVGGKVYQFRARTVNADGEYSTPEEGNYTNEEGWSPWTDPVATRPAPVKILSAKATSDGSIVVTWSSATTVGMQEVEEYVIEYALKERYFDTSPSNVTSTSKQPQIGDSQSLELTGLEAGIWNFRVAVKMRSYDVQSEWSNVERCATGKKPTPPTTWSNKTVAMVGEPLYLYWTHNSEDNSDETYAIVNYTINGVEYETDPIEHHAIDTEQRSYTIPEEHLNTEAIIQWKVKTKGVYENLPEEDGYSEWSTQRIIKVYTQPTISVTLFGSMTYEWDEYIEEHADDGGVYDYSIPGTSILQDNMLTNFPLFVRLNAGPSSQEPIAYSIAIVANNSYETSDQTGRLIGISAGTTVFRRYINTTNHQFTAMIMPGDVALENGISYSVYVTVAMNSGLSANNLVKFFTNFSVQDYSMNASIGIDPLKITAYIKPYCLDENDAYVTSVTMAVYRREFDGGFTKIADGIPGNLMPVITDPHPSLDYARYRLVAVDRATGHVEYQDLPPHRIGEHSIIIQWDETWNSYYETGAGVLADRPWSGSMVKLPFNIDTTDSNTVDVEMVEYIGRSHPVSYYGTQVGQKATWNTLIPVNDKQTIYDLRRLARYMGNAYVREPSGTGYWAHVEVSFNITHLETTIPVSFSITRVEGGM